MTPQDRPPSEQPLMGGVANAGAVPPHPEWARSESALRV